MSDDLRRFLRQVRAGIDAELSEDEYRIECERPLTAGQKAALLAARRYCDRRIDALANASPATDNLSAAPRR